MDKISYEDFGKVDFRVGTILEAEKVEGSEKLIRMQVDLGEMGYKTVYSGIYKWYKPEELIGKQTIFVVNIEPKRVMGELSEAMIFAAEDEEKGISLLIAEKEVENGSKVF
ncbi:MAG: methionine--tRNA ligase subunit beta [Candidatus Shapirobacteria bacterium]|jgi:methionine--tRNA ligase beta chain